VKNRGGFSPSWGPLRDPCAVKKGVGFSPVGVCWVDVSRFCDGCRLLRATGGSSDRSAATGAAVGKPGTDLGWFEAQKAAVDASITRFGKQSRRKAKTS
jgi:hypothetical protein